MNRNKLTGVKGDEKTRLQAVLGVIKQGGSSKRPCVR